MLKSTPKSSRFTVVVAEEPAWVEPSREYGSTPWNSTSRATNRVMSLRLSSPST